MQFNVRVMYRVVPPLAPMPVVDAQVFVIDEDEGGNGNDLLFLGTTDQNGAVDGNVEWVDANTVNQTVVVPGHFEGMPPRWVPAQNRTVTAPVPDVMRLSLEIRYDGRTERHALPPPLGPVFVNSDPPVDCIPQREPLPPIRAARLLARRGRYLWKQESGIQAGTIDVLPPDEAPHPRWTLLSLGSQAQVRANQDAVAALQQVEPFDRVDDYARLFPALGNPIMRNALTDDAQFAAARVAGPNPVVLARPAQLPASLALTDAHLAAFGLTVGQALQQGRLLVCDYAALDGVPVAAGRFITAPIAVFLLRDRAGAAPDLVPAAIQVDRHDPASIVLPDRPGQLVDPARPTRWQRAKLMVQVADLNHHEMISHLFDCHLAMEPFAVARARQLAPNHPIGRLLGFHFSHMLQRNEFARSQLINPGGPVDRFLGTGIAGALQIVRNGRGAWSFANAGLAAGLEARRMTSDFGPMPAYPYAEDAKDLDAVIRKHVTRWVGLYYANDGEVAGDAELQAWRSEVMDAARGGLGTLPALQTRGQLADVVAQIVFTCSAQHAAVNFTQFPYQGLVSSSPAHARADWRGQPTWMQILPSNGLAREQGELAWLLSALQWDVLGNYGPPLAHAATRDAVATFQQELLDLQQRLEKRDAQRPEALRYPYLQPRNVPNSIST
jgi:arachidonate 15-lipoxygenase